MTFAQTIKSYWQDYESAIVDAQNQAITIEQDWEYETTTYIFVDKSCLVDCNGVLTAYGSVD